MEDDIRSLVFIELTNTLKKVMGELNMNIKDVRMSMHKENGRVHIDIHGLVE